MFKHFYGGEGYEIMPFSPFSFCIIATFGCIRRDVFTPREGFFVNMYFVIYSQEIKVFAKICLSVLYISWRNTYLGQTNPMLWKFDSSELF